MGQPTRLVKVRCRPGREAGAVSSQEQAASDPVVTAVVAGG